MNSPKDVHILNKDDSITNKDGDNYLEKGEQPTERNKPDKEPVPAVPPDDNEEPEPPAEDKPSKKDSES